jgi:hypothetical protein
MSYLDILRAAKERLGLSEISEVSSFSPFVGVNANEDPAANKAKYPKESPSAYAHPWPDALPGLGHRSVGPFIACAECGAGTWARYGDRPLCLGCAQKGLR